MKKGGMPAKRRRMESLFGLFKQILQHEKAEETETQEGGDGDRLLTALAEQ
jgi:hypothetical protein